MYLGLAVNMVIIFLYCSSALILILLIGFSVPFLFYFPNLVIPKLQYSVIINMGHVSIQKCKQQIIIQR